MGTDVCLHELFIASARRSPQALAVVEPGQGSISYGELDALSDRLRDRLAELGVGRGDRVGIFLRKSIDSVATLLAALKVGAAYVPVDPGAPAARGAYILHNCAVKVAVVETALAGKLAATSWRTSSTPRDRPASRRA
jgi:non-ribosomal peptide synthetase component F